MFSDAYWDNTLWPLLTSGWGAQNAPYLFCGVGPDRKEDMIPVYTGFMYDPTNGTISNGDVAWSPASTTQK